MTSHLVQDDAPRPRTPLSRARVLHAAVDVADREGLDGLTMRRLAHELGVEAMSLYHHVANKEAVLDGVIDVVMEEIHAALRGHEAPDPVDDWRAAVRARILTARSVLLRHPWAPPVFETRTTMSPMVIGWFDGLVGMFRAGGFSYDLIHHAMHALGSRSLGFTQEMFQPDDAAAADAEFDELLEHMADQWPHLVGMLAEISHPEDTESLGWCDDQVEFEFGLDIILDGLARLRATA